MAYDDNAKKLAVKVIGTVESNLNYGSVNYNDPITVGIAQWYGTRAAALLERMRTTNSAAWYGVAASIGNQLASINQSNTYWNSRYLTQTEGNSLVGVMSRNQAIQNAQLIEDMEAYKAVAISYGFDPEANTATVIYFFAMHHQSPVSALRVVQTLDTSATLEQIHAATLADSVLGQYGGRYRTAYDLIHVADLSGVDPAPPVVPDPVQPNGNARHIRKHNDLLLVQFENEEQVIFYPSTADMWTPRKAADKPADPAPVQPPPPADNGTWVLPLQGPVSISSPYGPRPAPPGTMAASFHWGTDFTSGTDPANVVAPCPLKITVAYDGSGSDPSQGTAGRYVKGHTLDGAYTFNFYHMVAGSVAVSVGDTVATGQTLGTEGATGNVTGTHLHFEAYEGNLNSPWPPPYGNPVDPLPILRAHGVSI